VLLNYRFQQIALILCLWTSGATAAEPPVYDYRVTGKMPQSRDNYVQGLEFADGHLYVSTGEYGQSRLLRYRFSDGELVDGRKVDDRLFAEGLTVLGDRVYQLTWKAGLVLVYNKADLAGIEAFRIPWQGWGLTNNGSELIYSDGTNNLHYISPTNGKVSRTIKVMEMGKPVYRLNELEWINGKIWANVWRTDRIVIIDPDTGEVTASIDLSGLKPESTESVIDNVLNGIAQNPEDSSIWVTGKRWRWLFQIELIRRPTTDKQSAAADPESR